jgi:glycerol-3-phosphate dehydrogenase
MGGKWTTYRRMGEETVDEVVNLLKCKIISFGKNNKLFINSKRT